MSDRIEIAVAKGRIARLAWPILAAAGLEPAENPEESRNLVLETQSPTVLIIIVRAADVPAYVRLGGADLGIVGKDILIEQQENKIYELADLQFSKCRLIVAEEVNPSAALLEIGGSRNRVATKYVNTARRHFDSKGEYVNVVKLSGSVELAPLRGLAERIVDLTQTGMTLKTNGLREVETIAHSSARLVANKASMRLKEKPMKDLIKRISDAAEGMAGEDY